MLAQKKLKNILEILSVIEDGDLIRKINQIILNPTLGGISEITEFVCRTDGCGRNYRKNEDVLNTGKILQIMKEVE